MSLKRALLAATILAVPAAASAQPVTGLYIGAGDGGGGAAVRPRRAIAADGRFVAGVARVGEFG